MGSETKYTFYTQDGTPICEITGVAELGTVDDRNECAVPVLNQLLNQQTFELPLPMKKRDVRKLRKLWKGLKPAKKQPKRSASKRPARNTRREQMKIELYCTQGEFEEAKAAYDRGEFTCDAISCPFANNDAFTQCSICPMGWMNRKEQLIYLENHIRDQEEL